MNSEVVVWSQPRTLGLVQNGDSRYWKSVNLGSSLTVTDDLFLV